MKRFLMVLILTATPVAADEDPMQSLKIMGLASNLAVVLSSEEFCGLTLDQDGIAAWIKAAKKSGHEIPAPTIAEPVGRYSGKFIVRVPRSVHARLARKAKQEGVSLNQLISSVLSRA